MSRSDRKRPCADGGRRASTRERLERIPPGKRRAAAVGVWLAALCCSSQYELDGFCPTEALHGFANDEVIQDLVDVGLFVRGQHDGLVGVVVVDYAEEVKRLPGEVLRLVVGAASDQPKANHGRRPS